MSGNPYARCPDCGVRHDPERGCLADRDTEPHTMVAAGAGDGVYHPAPFLKKGSRG